jgi:hypothetical protein
MNEDGRINAGSSLLASVAVTDRYLSSFIIVAMPTFVIVKDKDPAIDGPRLAFALGVIDAVIVGDVQMAQFYSLYWM